MAKAKIQELTGAALDYAVAVSKYGQSGLKPFKYSSDWRYGGPTIERECIELNVMEEGVYAARISGWMNSYVFGNTYLIAAMRCYVASRLGDIVEIPEELMK